VQRVGASTKLALHRPARRKRLDETGSSFGEEGLKGNPPIFFAKRSARSDASSMSAWSACLGLSSLVTSRAYLAFARPSAQAPTSQRSERARRSPAPSWRPPPSRGSAPSSPPKGEPRWRPAAAYKDMSYRRRGRPDGGRRRSNALAGRPRLASRPVARWDSRLPHGHVSVLRELVGDLIDKV
jgi:hypothetical protein